VSDLSDTLIYFSQCLLSLNDWLVLIKHIECLYVCLLSKDVLYPHISKPKFHHKNAMLA